MFYALHTQYAGAQQVRHILGFNTSKERGAYIAYCIHNQLGDVTATTAEPIRYEALILKERGEQCDTGGVLHKRAQVPLKRPPPGRVPDPDKKTRYRRVIPLTRDQWAAFDMLGGVDWLKSALVMTE